MPVRPGAVAYCTPSNLCYSAPSYTRIRGRCAWGVDVPIRTFRLGPVSCGLSRAARSGCRLDEVMRISSGFSARTGGNAKCATM